MAKESFDVIPPGLENRIYVSVFGGILLLIGVILYLAFVPNTFTTFQNIAIILVALLVLGAILTAIWVPWGMKFARHAKRWEKEMKAWGKKMEREIECEFGGKEMFFGWVSYRNRKRSVVSSLSGIALLIFVILYLAFYPTNLTLFQNIAIILVAILLVGAINAMVWVPAGMRQATEFKKMVEKGNKEKERPKKKK